MTSRAKELLKIMASKFDETNDNSLSFTDYIGFPDEVVDELENAGCIEKINDIIGTINLTPFGYAESGK